MNLFGLSIITVLGGVLVIAGAIGLIRFAVRYRRTSEHMNREETEDKNDPPNTFATLYLFNGMFHIGWLLLTLGGVGLIFIGQR